MPNFRPRISILTALLLMTLLAMALVIAQQWREVGPLRAEVQELREQVGVLKIEDPAKIHAIAVPSDAEGVVRWRVYVPAGTTAVLRAKGGDIARTGYPEGKFQRDLGAGEHLLKFTAEKHGSHGSWVAEIKSPQSYSMIALGFKDEDLFGTGMLESQRVSSKTETMNKSGKLTLVRTRYAPPGNSQIVATETPLPGFIIWLDKK